IHASTPEDEVLDAEPIRAPIGPPPQEDLAQLSGRQRLLAGREERRRDYLGTERWGRGSGVCRGAGLKDRGRAAGDGRPATGDQRSKLRLWLDAYVCRVEAGAREIRRRLAARRPSPVPRRRPSSARPPSPPLATQPYRLFSCLGCGFRWFRAL